MSKPDEPPREPDMEAFLGDATTDLEDWRWLWRGDRAFPITSHRGLVGRLIVSGKKLLRPLVRAPQNDLWERQRTFNLVLISHLETLHRLEGVLDALGKDVQRIQAEILHDLRTVQRELDLGVKQLSDDLDDFQRRGMADLMVHTDALFSRLDQKLDRLRRRISVSGVEPSDTRPDAG
jgi:hypothetical protein